ncbi:MAG: hypothetical protein NW237_08355, partial [Cyanobacteriota bacterium]|nr:hypothetical protein [Cyanobacteriota bacterium]
FVQSLTLDVSELFEEPEPIQYPANRKQQLSRQEEGSLVGDVDKDALLSWIDQTVMEPPLNALEMAAQLRDLAHGETVEEWSRAIAQYLRQFPSTICISDLQQALAMPLVELWLGLLIGGYSLTQHGEFYDNQTLWIINYDGEV